VPSGSPPPPGSLSEVSSRHPYPPVFEQGRPSKKILVVDHSSSSDEKDLIPDITWDAEFTKKLFGNLNRELPGSLDDYKIIILNDSDEEIEEVHEEDAADAETVPSSAVKSPTPTTSAANTDDADKGHSPDRVIGDSSNGGDEASSP
jgi:hypothetical protein